MRSRILSLLVLVSVIFIRGAIPTRAQDDPHAACAAPPSYVPTELLERAVPLRSGIGNSHETVTTKFKEAQAFYDQGLNYLESYVWIEASRSFRQALRLDPNLAMANLGLSYVYSGLENPDAARQLLEKAKALASGASDPERRRIDIRDKQLAAIADVKDASLFLAYKKAIDDALAQDFENPQLWLLRGNAEETNASGRGQRGGAASIAFYATALRLAPDYVSAHHYLVHSYETIGRIDEALVHGEAYARLAPSIPCRPHVGSRPSPWGRGRRDRAIQEGRRARARLLRRREDGPRASIGITRTTSTCSRAATSTRGR
jgi:tetratricopeptide (TPR) repeat protein